MNMLDQNHTVMGWYQYLAIFMLEKTHLKMKCTESNRWTFAIDFDDSKFNFDSQLK